MFLNRLGIYKSAFSYSYGSISSMDYPQKCKTSKAQPQFEIRGIFATGVRRNGRKTAFRLLYKRLANLVPSDFSVYSLIHAMTKNICFKSDKY